jgi:UDP-N-acetylmuramate: L-alanyl-gamma-D-glutamyl-meso-diaminopimelate ligase
MHIHILGICGTLMGSLAVLAKQAGHRVSGSDQNVYPPMSSQLESAGIELRKGYREEHLKPDPDLVIVGNANLPRGNPALEYVLNRGLPYVSGAEWLGTTILKDRWVIAVAGTHGKTTTASMAAWILEYAGLSPGYLIGGIPCNFEQSASLGKDPFFVIEADEYDTSYFDRRAKFLHYKPRTVILNNLEYDHADIYPNLEAIQDQFGLFLRSIPENGKIIRPEIDGPLDEVIDRGCWTPIEYVSCKSLHHGWQARPLDDGCSEFEVWFDQTNLGTVRWQLLGMHNMHNAQAAIAACRHAGVRPETSIQALSEFTGVKRRMELLLDTGSARFYDDFAHHPTAISTTLEGLKGMVGNDEVIAIIEPASHTMRKGVHQHTLADACQAADSVLWYDPGSLTWDLEGMVAADPARFSYWQSINEILAYIKIKIEDTNRKQHFVIMSNGSFNHIYTKIRALKSPP